MSNNSNRSFGILFSILFALVFIYYYLKHDDFYYLLIFLSLIFLLLGIFKSRILTPLNKVWIKFGIYLGKIIAPVIMMIIFFLVVFPTNLILKFFNKDILRIKSKNEKSYWIKKEKNTGTMDQQF